MEVLQLGQVSGEVHSPGDTEKHAAVAMGREHRQGPGETKGGMRMSLKKIQKVPQIFVQLYVYSYIIYIYIHTYMYIYIYYSDMIRDCNNSCPILADYS